MASLDINKTEFKNYKECSPMTARKEYKKYLELSGKSVEQKLNIYDVSRIDNVPLEIVKQRCGKSMPF